MSLNKTKKLTIFTPRLCTSYGFSGSIDYNQSKINADHQSVSEQSGILTGDDCFQINVKNHTELKGGLITSTDKAEQAGKNRFQTATINSSDLQNFSRYEGESFGIGMSGGVNGKGDERINGNEKVRWAAQGQTADNGLAKGEGIKGAKFSASFGYGRDRESESSTTKSGIGTKNIAITDEKAQQTRTRQTAEQTAQSLYTDIRTETAEEQSGRLQNVFDKERVQKELDVQREVSQQFSKNVQEAKAEINRKLDALEEQKKAGIISQSEYEKERKNWDTLHLGLSIVSGALLAPTDSALGIVAAAASPKVTQEIGKLFKEGGALHKHEGKALHGIAQGIWAAAVAYAGGNNALAAGLSAGGSELAAPILSDWLYGEKDGSKLNAEQKQTVSAVLGTLGAGATAASNSNAASVAAAGQAGANAVENNYNIWQERVHSGDYFTCLQGGGGEDFCNNYRPFGLPDIVSIKTSPESIKKYINNQKIINKINKLLPKGVTGDYDVHLAVNPFNGDVFIITEIGLNIQTEPKGKEKKKQSNLSFSWLVPNREDFIAKDDKVNVPNHSLKQKEVFAKTVREQFQGSATSYHVCHKGICGAVSKTFNSDKSKYFLTLGSGNSIGSNVENAMYIGNIKDFLK